MAVKDQGAVATEFTGDVVYYAAAITEGVVYYATAITADVVYYAAAITGGVVYYAAAITVDVVRLRHGYTAGRQSEHRNRTRKHRTRYSYG